MLRHDFRAPFIGVALLACLSVLASHAASQPVFSQELNSSEGLGFTNSSSTPLSLTNVVRLVEPFNPPFNFDNFEGYIEEFTVVHSADGTPGNTASTYSLDAHVNNSFEFVTGNMVFPFVKEAFSRSEVTLTLDAPSTVTLDATYSSTLSGGYQDLYSLNEGMIIRADLYFGVTGVAPIVKPLGIVQPADVGNGISEVTSNFSDSDSVALSLPAGVYTIYVEVVGKNENPFPYNHAPAYVGSSIATAGLDISVTSD